MWVREIKNEKDYPGASVTVNEKKQGSFPPVTGGSPEELIPAALSGLALLGHFCPPQTAYAPPMDAVPDGSTLTVTPTIIGTLLAPKALLIAGTAPLSLLAMLFFSVDADEVT